MTDPGGVPLSRVRGLNGAPASPDGDFVLYWMTMSRRTRWSFALQRAAAWAHAAQRPLVVFEALRCDYPWASDRFHRFLLDGMRDHADALRERPVLYLPYVEPAPRAGKGLLAALASRAVVVVTDDYPAFMIPAMTAAAARQVAVRLEAVDASGLLPVRASGAAFSSAFSFRRHLQRELPRHLAELPEPDPLAGRLLPLADRSTVRKLAQRWPELGRSPREVDLSRLPVDHGVGAVETPGGERAGSAALERFVRDTLPRYAEERNHPDAAATSGLSPYLHFGHVSTHQVFHAVALREIWSAGDLAPRATGKRQGWWGMGGAAEAFLDQLVTWRELGFNACVFLDSPDAYESLPRWAIDKLAAHALDPRPYRYSREQLEAASTHDDVWNAAQIELSRHGRLHNYLRMLWGKKILEWTREPREALAVMLALNDKYALDGRDPNSLSGIFWCLGRYDRPWGPERPVFGTVRYMSSSATVRKLRMREYLDRYRP